MVDIRYSSRSFPGEVLCGDQMGSWRLNDHSQLICLVDGLGHGPMAYQAAKKCLSVVDQYCEETLEEIIAQCNAQLVSSRGVAMSLVRIDSKEQCLTYCGVGNVEACILTEKPSHFVNTYGIVGAEPSIQALTQQRAFRVGQDMLIMYTDGMPSGLPLEKCQQKIFNDLESISSWMIECWGKDSDDVSVVVAA